MKWKQSELRNHLKLESVRNIKLKELVASKDYSKYDSVLHFINLKNKFIEKESNIETMPYINVRYCIKLLTKIEKWENICELFCLCFDIKNDYFWESDLINYYQARNYLLKEFKNIVETEQKMLSSSFDKDTLRWELAGIKRLEPYSDYLPLDRIGQRYSINPMELGRKPYSEVFYLQCMIKTDNEILKAFNEIT
jgi:hypothetical protein